MRGPRSFQSVWLFVLVAAIVVAGCGGATSTSSPSVSPTPLATPQATGRVLPTPTPDLASASPAPPPSGGGPTGPTKKARVVDVVDGDTIRVRLDGVDYPVRYIGMDAPERGDPFFREATQANNGLVGGKRVWLEKDTSETDQFDRLLRHVWVKVDGSWLLVDSELVRLGLAEAKTYPPDTKYDEIYADAQTEAQDAGVGLWADVPHE